MTTSPTLRHTDAPARPDLTPPTQPPRDASERFAHLQALDGLRGLAVLGVVLFHFAPDVAPGGFLGVDLFFVLSGFLITSLLVSEWQATEKISLLHFWARRARRLLPALLLVLGTVGVYVLFMSNRVDAQHVSVDGLWALFYGANWHFITSGQAYVDQFLAVAPSPLRHTWSLAIEEQFYLVWPIVVLGIAAIFRRRTEGARRQRGFRFAVVAVCAVLGAASFARMLMLNYRGADLNRIYYGTDSRVFVILIGAALGAISAGAPTVVRKLRPALIVVGTGAAAALLALMAWLTTTSTWLYEGGYGIVAALMVVVLAAAAQPGRNPLARALQLRVLVGLGLISYGVYLWHWPIALWITEENTGLDGVALFVVRSVVTLGAALLSYVFVEQPIRRGRLPSRGLLRPQLLTPAVVVLVAVLLAIPALSLPSLPTPADATSPLAAAITAKYETAPRCDGSPGVPVAPGRSLLIQLEGNSLAGELRNCLRSIFASRGATFETVNPPDFLICRDAPDIVKQVRNPATRPDAAILFAFVAGDNRCGKPWHKTVDKLVAAWKAAGTHVYLVPTVPFVPGSPREDVLGSFPVVEAGYYQQLADQDPAHVTVVDAGAFLRDTDGSYGWRMPCVQGGEPGCDARNTVGVRWVDGLHFCTDPNFAAEGCLGVEHQAGERRASAAVAAAIIADLQANPSHLRAPERQ